MDDDATLELEGRVVILGATTGSEDPFLRRIGILRYGAQRAPPARPGIGISISFRHRRDGDDDDVDVGQGGVSNIDTNRYNACVCVADS